MFTAKSHSIIEAEFSYFETFRLENRWGGGRETKRWKTTGDRKLNYLFSYPPHTKNWNRPERKSVNHDSREPRVRGQKPLISFFHKRTMAADVRVASQCNTPSRVEAGRATLRYSTWTNRNMTTVFDEVWTNSTILHTQMFLYTAVAGLQTLNGSRKYNLQLVAVVLNSVWTNQFLIFRRSEWMSRM